MQVNEKKLERFLHHFQGTGFKDLKSFKFTKMDDLGPWNEKLQWITNFTSFSSPKFKCHMEIKQQHKMLHASEQKMLY